MICRDYENNPIIKPMGPTRIVADPTILEPHESPDGLWHMFTSTDFRISHWKSEDGIHWEHVRNYFWSSYTQWIYAEGGRYYLFYQKMRWPISGRIVVRISEDLEEWSKPIEILKGTLKWEKRRIGYSVRNPCLLKVGEEYWLYYSGGTVFLPKLGWSEPKHIGLAKSKKILGPYKKLEKPILSPDPNHKYRHLACGGMRVYKFKDVKYFIGLENGFYYDEAGKTRSAILLLASEDGIHWKDVMPLILPSKGWKRGLVFQLDVVRIDDELWIYYNARSGFRIGSESIGLSFCDFNAIVETVEKVIEEV